MTIIQAITLGVVEGLTEFLPISSTGHMILTGSVMGVPDDDFTKLFDICIQLGAIMSVLVLYRHRFMRQSLEFYKKLLVAVSPALVLGFLFNKKIDALLESDLTVACTMLFGGVVLLFVDNFFREAVVARAEDIKPKQALAVGFWQVLAMIPGMSRSACTIIGGMQQKLTREAAAEFSFFLAVPTMAAATGYKLLKALLKQRELLTDPNNLMLLAVGNLVAFIVAILAIKTFITYLKRHGFRVFGIYRVIMGVVVLGMLYGGYLK
ncbi:undecaprenyl-diphosphate phosphatase [bacterium]|nr:undecaprenyl-diphosphate phosphatase [bacterium]